MTANTTSLSSDHIRWSSWYPHEGSWLGTLLPDRAGLYRIRRSGHDDLDYIGQTGSGSMTLRKRQAMLKGIYGAEMPYRDPHTVGPALWALRHALGCSLEVSVAVIEGRTPWRKGLEAVAIALYRQQHGRSPTLNFGRMPGGYQMSSANNARIVAAGNRYRGGTTTLDDASHLPGIPPAGPLDRDPCGSRWCGHDWMQWTGILDAPRDIPPDGLGLYRIRLKGANQHLYIGEGKVRSRLTAHLDKASVPNHRQADLFRDPHALEVSWVLNRTWYQRQRLELETDLIGAHVLAVGDVPAAQFLG
jgi:hypothetical protein